MTDGKADIRLLSEAEIDSQTLALAELLIDAVDAGASVGFHPPLSLDKARPFFADIRERVRNYWCTVLLEARELRQN
jgi:hypothetical protein